MTGLVGAPNRLLAGRLLGVLLVVSCGGRLSAPGSDSHVTASEEAAPRETAPSSCPTFSATVSSSRGSPFVVNVDDAHPRALPANLLGANSELTGDAMDWANDGYQQAVQGLGLSWARYSGGTLSDAYDWRTGGFRWADAFPGGAWTSTCLLNPRDSSCGAGWGSEEMYRHWNTINEDKSGKMALPAWESFTRGSGVKTVVTVNVFTDSPSSAEALARQLSSDGIDPVLWEMGNETFDYQHWHAPSDGYWATQHVEQPFANGGDYVSHVKPFAEAIRQVFPHAHIGVVSAVTNDLWNKDLADWSTSKAAGGNCEGASASEPCDTAHFPVYFDTLVVHSYECTFLPQDRDLEAECMNRKLQTVASALPEQVVTHPGCGTSNCTQWISGFAPSVAYTEVNVGLEGGDGAQVLIPESSMRGTLFASVYLAEFVARSASDAVTHVKHVGIQQLYGDWFALINGKQEPQIRAQLQSGPLAGGTATADYGLFYTVPGLALSVLGGALRSSAENLPTTFESDPNEPQVKACAGAGTTDTSTRQCASGTVNVPAIGAFTWRVPGTPQRYHLVLTNKGAQSAAVELQLRGDDLQPTSAPQVTVVAGDRPYLTNTSVSSDGTTTDTAAVVQKGCSLGGASTYEVPPYSITRIDWAQ